MSIEQIAELTALEAKATPGPWEGSDDRHMERLDIYSPGDLMAEFRWLISLEQGVDDLALILALRNHALPIIHAQQQRIADLTAALTKAERERDSATEERNRGYAGKVLRAQEERERQVTEILRGPAFSCRCDDPCPFTGVKREVAKALAILEPDHG